jgi:hypothetical protein
VLDRVKVLLVVGDGLAGRVGVFVSEGETEGSPFSESGRGGREERNETGDTHVGEQGKGDRRINEKSRSSRQEEDSTTSCLLSREVNKERSGLRRLFFLQIPTVQLNESKERGSFDQKPGYQKRMTGFSTRKRVMLKHNCKIVKSLPEEARPRLLQLLKHTMPHEAGITQAPDQGRVFRLGLFLHCFGLTGSRKSLQRSLHPTLFLESAHNNRPTVSR